MVFHCWNLSIHIGIHSNNFWNIIHHFIAHFLLHVCFVVVVAAAAEELSVNHSKVIWHLKQIGKMKSSISECLMSWPQIKKFLFCSGGLRWDPRHKGPFCPSLWLACSTETDISYNNPTQPLTGHPGGPPSQPSEQLSSSNQLSLTLPLVGATESPFPLSA